MLILAQQYFSRNKTTNKVIPSTLIQFKNTVNKLDIFVRHNITEVCYGKLSYRRISKTSRLIAVITGDISAWNVRWENVFNGKTQSPKDKSQGLMFQSLEALPVVWRFTKYKSPHLFFSTFLSRRSRRVFSCGWTDRDGFSGHPTLHYPSSCSVGENGLRFLNITRVRLPEKLHSIISYICVRLTKAHLAQLPWWNSRHAYEQHIHFNTMWIDQLSLNEHIIKWVWTP